MTPPTVIAVVDPSNVADPSTNAEASFYEDARKGIENDGLRQDNEARKTTREQLFWLIAIWLALDMIIVFLQGFQVVLCSHKFYLPNTILVTLITSTTASVIGLFAIVVRSLFPFRK